MGRFSFTRTSRLFRSAEFLKVRKSGRRFSSKSFTVHMLPNGLKWSRLGLSVSSKVGPAARRNRIKRLLREFFRLHIKDTLEVPSDIVVSVKKGAEIKGLRDVEEELLGGNFL